MACVALTSLMATIELEFLHPNHRVSLLHHDEKPLKSLLQKLSSLEAFLEKEYNNAVGGVPIQRHLLNKIRDFSLKAEDAIEIQLSNILQLQQKAHQGELHLHLHLHQSLQEVAKEAEELLKVINNQDVSPPLIGWSEAAASHPHNIIVSSSGVTLQCSPLFKEYVVPGIRSYYLTLKAKLLDDILSPERSVITIVGVPGIGKTTFCKMMYTDKVVPHFDIHAWITIPPRYNGDVQQLLCHLLQSMRPTLLNQEIDMLQGSTVSQLKNQLHKHLKCKRYFIVLDDVPNTLLWDDIHQCFPDDSNRSLILLTTPFTDVAEYISRDRDSINILPYLDGLHSWFLFSNRFSPKEQMTPKFEEIARHLVEDCRAQLLQLQTWFESFDDVVSSNSNLQTLTVPGIEESTLGARTLHVLPSKIWESQHLRHLKLGDMYMIDPPNMVKEHLQTLVCTMPIHFRKKEVYYCKFPNIRKLKVVYKDVLVPGCSGGRCCRNPIIILENFADLLMLEILTVTVPVGSITLLQRLGFPANLEKLRLSGTNFPVKVLTVIGQLPKLKVLKLENAFYGRVWELVEGEFPILEVLEIESRSLERWVANTNNHFPMLREIFLKRCYSLEEIPPISVNKYLRFWTIKLEQCHPSVATSAEMYQEEMRRNKYFAPRIIFVDTSAKMYEEERRPHNEFVVPRITPFC
ncbi:PREDICTED: putative late blight resistance protein homolog R1B-13 [Ipomoea nil]|uniref:putative late blight resistance protein homolog R1B-13 n=1 Tax=Ipomoea nil TaxID=35883 RepID=UPI00090201A0|nr:PREDICTED: putative late blight resistance protein homolog R1B-13 [Ipomoea nil]